ncbi:MAG: ABC transporter permease, partial [Geminicoccaceae bacterium]
MSLRIEPRRGVSWGMLYATPPLAVALTVVTGFFLFMFMGYNPFKALMSFFISPLLSGYQLAELGVKAAPLITIAVGLAIGFRANVWNIGAEGQFVLGAIAASGVAMHATAESSHWIVAPNQLAGVLGGMAWAAIVAVQRDRANASEIQVSLMLVYVANQFLNYLVYGDWKDPAGYNFPQTITFADPTKIPRLFSGLRLNIGFIVALLSVATFWLFLFRVYAGFQMQVGGLAPAAARYAGFSSRRALWTALLISGGMAGLAGAFEVAGPIGQLTPYVPAGYGFAAIIVAFVGRLHPVGILFSSLL